MEKNERIINRLLNYRNGVHGEFFLSVVDHIKLQQIRIDELENLDLYDREKYYLEERPVKIDLCDGCEHKALEAFDGSCWHPKRDDINFKCPLKR